MLRKGLHVSTKILTVLTILSVSFSAYADRRGRGGDHDRGSADRSRRFEIADKYPLFENLRKELDRLDGADYKVKLQNVDAATGSVVSTDVPVTSKDGETLTKFITFAANYIEVQDSCSDDPASKATKQLFEKCLVKNGVASGFLNYGTPPEWTDVPISVPAKDRVIKESELGVCFSQMTTLLDKRAEKIGSDVEKHSPADKLFKENLGQTFKILTGKEFKAADYASVDTTVEPLSTIVKAAEEAIAALDKEKACHISLETKSDKDGEEIRVPSRDRESEEERTRREQDRERDRRLKEDEGKVPDPGNIKEGIPQATTAKSGGGGEEPPKDPGPKNPPGTPNPTPTPFQPTPGLQTQADPGALSALDDGFNRALDDFLRNFRDDNIIQPAVVTPPASNSGGDRSVSTPPEAPLPSIPPVTTPPASQANSKPENQATPPFPPPPQEPGNLGQYAALPPEKQSTQEVKENKDDPTTAALLAALTKLNQAPAVEPATAAAKAAAEKMGQIVPLLQQGAGQQQGLGSTKTVQGVLGSGTGGFGRQTSNRTRGSSTVKTASSRSGARENIATSTRRRNTQVSSIGGTGTAIRVNGLGQQPRTSSGGVRGPLRK